jgi:hypothetical protein
MYSGTLRPCIIAPTGRNDKQEQTRARKPGSLVSVFSSTDDRPTPKDETHQHLSIHASYSLLTKSPRSTIKSSISTSLNPNPLASLCSLPISPHFLP